MSHKINPILLRTGINSFWNHDWFNLKVYNNFHINIIEDKCIQQILKNFFLKYGYMVQKIVIYKNIFNIYIYIEVMPPYPVIPLNENMLIMVLKTFLKNTNVQLKCISIYKDYRKFYKKQQKNYNNLKFVTKRLRFFRYNIKLINIINYVFYYKNSKILLDFLVYIFERQHHKQHFRIISPLKKLLKIIFKKNKLSFHNLKGLKICIKGRINGRNRSRKIWIKLGFISLLTLKNKIDYKYSEFINKDGIFGIKIWLFLK